MQAFLYSNGNACEVEFVEGVAQIQKKALLWLHVDGQDKAALDWLEKSDLPDLVKKALAATETRPRGDVIGDGLLLNLRGLGKEDVASPDSLVSVRIWAEKHRCISLDYFEPIAVDEVIERFLRGEIRDAGDLLAAFADANKDQLDPDVAHIGDTLDKCEIEIDADDPFSLKTRIAEIRSKAVTYRRFIAPQRAALDRLANAEVNWLDEDDRAHLRDAADRAARMTEELETVRERAALLHEELSDRRAELMEGRAFLISIVALVFLPLTFLTGLLGMNVNGIPFANEPWAFWGVIAFCVLMGLAMLAYFYREHWISRS